MAFFKKSDKDRALLEWEQFVVKEPCALDAIFEHLPQGEEETEMGTALVNIFFKHQNAVQIRNAAIAFAKENFTVNELFSTPNIALVILGEYVRLFGQEYLKKVVGPTVKAVNSGKLRYEIDPQRFTDLDDPRKNFNNLINDTQKLLDEIYKNKDKIPVFIKETVIMLHSAMNEMGSASPYAIVGRFLFLWFFCPAVVNPQRFDVKKGKSKEGQRGLVLVSKLMQNVAREIDTFEKGDFMQNAADFIQDNMKSLRIYADYILNPDGKSDPKRSYKLKKSSEDYAVKVFVFCKERLKKIVDWVEENYSGELANQFEDQIFNLCRVYGMDAEMSADYGQVWERVERRMKRVTRSVSIDGENSGSSSDRTRSSSKKSALRSLVETSPARLEAYTDDSPSLRKSRKGVGSEGGSQGEKIGASRRPGGGAWTEVNAPPARQRKESRASYDADVMTFDTVSGIDDVFNRTEMSSPPSRSKKSSREEDDEEEMVQRAPARKGERKQQQQQPQQQPQQQQVKGKKAAQPSTSSDDDDDDDDDAESSSSDEDDVDEESSSSESESSEEEKPRKKRSASASKDFSESEDSCSTSTTADPDNCYLIKCYRGPKVKLCLIPYGSDFQQFRGNLFRKWEVKGKEGDKMALVYSFNDCEYSLRVDTYDIFINNAMTKTGGQLTAKVWLRPLK